MESVSSDEDGQQFGTTAPDEQSLLRSLTPEERHRAILEAELSDESPPLQFDPWDRKFLQRAQLSDPDISFIYELVLDAAERPSWNRMPIKSFDAKVLWKNWSHLSVRDGVLVRKFEFDDGRDDFWQVIIPKALRGQFLDFIRGGSADRASFKKSASAVRAGAYWPTWSSDLASYISWVNSRIFNSNSASSSGVRKASTPASIGSGTEELACGYVEADRCQPVTSAATVDGVSTGRMQSGFQFRVGTWVPRGTPPPRCECVQSVLRVKSEQPVRRHPGCCENQAC